jgi:hypothetical protein
VQEVSAMALRKQAAASCFASNTCEALVYYSK